jgi:hypothetical protein
MATAQLKKYYQLLSQFKKMLKDNTPGTDDDELNWLGFRLFGSQWGGAVARNEVKSIPPTSLRFWLINTANRGGDGHWLGLYRNQVFDSFKRSTSTLFPEYPHLADSQAPFIRALRKQPDKSDDCGERSLAYLAIVSSL